MDEINKTDELQHWGIKGMRWGIRRSKKQLLKESGKKKAEMEGESFKTSKKKSVSKLSDDELKKEVDRRRLENDLQRQKNDALDIENRRLELEKKYAELNPKKLSLGQRMYDDIWPRAKKATLDAGETLLRDSLVSKGKELLGISGQNPVDRRRADATADINFVTKYNAAASRTGRPSIDLEELRRNRNRYM